MTTRPLDPSLAEARVEMRLAQAEQASKASIRSTAEQWWSISRVLREARESPEIYVDPLLPMKDDGRVEFAERAAAADVAVRLGISENTVRGQAHLSDMLQERMPRMWDLFSDGDVAVANVRHAAELLTSLSLDAAGEFDAAIAEVAGLSPTRFRVKARVLRERIHSTPLAERAKAAREKRGVWLENGPDGQADLILHGPAEVLHAGFARIDAQAKALAKLPDESRTLPQLRFDIAGQLMLATDGTTAPHYTVALTLPAATAAGISDEPATLEGYGPIDADTARRIGAAAPSFKRILTNRFTGGVIDIDSGSYRPPADMKRFLETTDQYCTFTGCGRLARNSDLDHTVDYQYGGKTMVSNLAHLCRHHHRLKHQTKWTVVQNPTGSASKLTWTSPTGHTTASDPPPF